MYLILNHANRVVDITPYAQYVTRQDNGVTISCAFEDADGIYSASSDSFYPIEQTGYIGDGHTLIEVEEIPSEVEVGYYFYHAGEFYTTEDELARLKRARIEADTHQVAALAFVKLVETEVIDDITAVEHSALFIEWSEHYTGTRGSIVNEDGTLYKALHDIGAGHSANRPSKSPTLWKPIGNPGEEYPAWSQPIAGVDNFYRIGDKVSHKGKRWVCSQENTAQGNSYEPGVWGWTEVAA